MEKWTTNPREVYRGPVFSVLSGTAELDDGTSVTRDVVHHQGSVAIVATRGDCVLLTSQSRIAVGTPVLEIPAGRIEKDETPEQAALRELREETGYTGSVTPGPVYYSSVGFLDERVHIFFAFDVKRISNSEKLEKPEPDEKIVSQWMPLSEIARDLRTYRFSDSKTIIGLREVLAHLNLNDQMVDDKSLYAWYSDENHKYNTLIWQFPIAIVGLNVLAVERLWRSAPLIILLWLINNVLLLCVGKHVYHQRRFTNALKEIARRFLIMHPNAPVVTFPRPKGKWWLPLTNFPVTYLLFWSLFLLNQILLLVFLWLRW
jgi:ADP-ribose pyrophosphatase